MSRVHSEIQYGQVHSDLCPPGCTTINMNTEWRKLIHQALDEFIDKAPSTAEGGEFYITIYPSEGFSPGRIPATDKEK